MCIRDRAPRGIRSPAGIRNPPLRFSAYWRYGQDVYKRQELETFARAVGAQGLLDKEDKKVKEHPACYYNQDGMILDAMLEAPWLMRSPIVRRCV